MSDYTIAVDWAGKDNLADSSAAKVISGTDFNTEFSAARVAINTKADINGDASEAFSAVTANAGTNTTQVATTAFVTTASTVAASSNGYGTRTVGTGNATGGSNGDIHYKVAS